MPTLTRIWVVAAAMGLAGTLTVSHACAAERPKIAASDLLSDASLLERTYKELHPGLNRYNTPGDIDKAFADLRRKLSHDLSLADAYLAFSEFAAVLRCGHTYANFFNQPESTAKALFDGQNRVPFEFRWVNREMIVTRNLSQDASLLPGTEILSINGVSVQRILARLMTVARAEGRASGNSGWPDHWRQQEWHQWGCFLLSHATGIQDRIGCSPDWPVSGKSGEQHRPKERRHRAGHHS